MNEDQAERIVRELREIKRVLWAALLTAAILFLGTRAIGCALGASPPTVSHAAPK